MVKVMVQACTHRKNQMLINNVYTGNYDSDNLHYKLFIHLFIYLHVKMKQKFYK